MALESRLRRIRASSCWSLRTSAPQATKSRRSPSLAATWRYSAARLPSSSPSSNGAMSGVITPASSLEMSTRVPSRFSTSSSEWLMLFTSASLSRVALPRSCKALVNSRAAFSGCSRSWLTAARNLVFDKVGLFRLALGLAQARLDLAALVDLALELVVEGGQLGGPLAHPLFEVLVGLVQRLGGTPALGDIADQHEQPGDPAVGLAVRHVGALHVAFLAGQRGLGDLEGHAFAGQGPLEVRLQPSAVLGAMHVAQAAAEHRAAGPAVPLLVDLVGEFVDQFVAEIGDQRRHLVGDQADPALAGTQRLGVAIALGDVGEGVDEAAGGQRVGTDLQHPAIEQALLAGTQRTSLGVPVARREQRQFALRHDLGEGPVPGDRRQPTEFQEAPVPQLQHAVGADHRHALGEVVHRPLQQVRLLRQRLLAARGLAELDLGDVAVEHRQPAVAGRPFAHPQPALVAQAVQGLLVAAALLLDDQTAAARQPVQFGAAHARTDPRPAVDPQRAEALVEQHDALLRIEQDEGVGDAFDGVEQMLVGGLGTQASVTEQLVAGLQFEHRLAQRVGALADLLGQHHGILESAVGLVALRGARLDASDQRLVDPLQLVPLFFEGDDPRLQLSDGHLRGVGQWRPR
ncbi:Uncharacterised protein [Pseudomonas aeruginosa]|nr:Uncharacterised protein [Pseudomonas aeruginosa]